MKTNRHKRYREANKEKRKEAFAEYRRANLRRFAQYSQNFRDKKRLLPADREAKIDA